MRTIPDKKLTTNFSLYEFIEAKMEQQAVEMNWRNIEQMDIERYEKEVAPHAQSIRDLINREFRSDTGAKEIGLMITSGWRCREWELFRGRSGEGQHPIAAYDCVPTNCSIKQAASIVGFLQGKFSRSYVGGFAIKTATVKDGAYVSAGFVHFDFRGKIARWRY